LVLAAHEPVAELDLGIVAKIDVAEIRAPFVRSGVIALCFAVLVVLAGSAFFLRISNPIIRRLQEHGAELRKSNEKLTGEIKERKQVEEALRKTHDELEMRVRERTAELSEANLHLEQEIAERKRTEQALRLNESRLEALMKLNQIKDLLLNETADFVLEEGVKLTKSEIGFLGFVNEPETDMAIHAWSKNAMKQCSVIEKPMHFPIEAAGLWGEAVRKRKPVVINDYSIPLTQKRGYPQGHVKLSRFMVVPLLDRGRIVVVAGMANKLEEYDLTDIHQLTLLLDGMWRIFQHKRDEEALRRSEVELRRLSSELLRAHEEESKRIGQELHDGLAQTLSAIKVWAEAALKQIEQENPAEVAKSLEFILPLAQGAVEEVRRIIRNLRPSILDDLGLVATISWLCQEFEKIYAGIGVERQIDIREDDLADSLKIIIFRVLQEALNNIAKHSQADLTHITMKKTEGRIQLTIIDNGVGVDAEQALSGKKSKGGIGLASMKERTKLSGGSFSIVSSLGNGTTIRAEWPANASI